MKRRWTVGAALGAVVLVVPGLLATGAAASDQDETRREAERQAAELGLQTTPAAAPGERPRSANPYVSLLPDPGTADYIGWNRVLQAAGEERANKLAQKNAAARVRQPLSVADSESATEYGDNDSVATAQQVKNLGTGKRDNPRAHVTGALAPEPVETVTLPRAAEDDGAIPLARVTGIDQERASIRTEGSIGDGPHGSAGDQTGDFDFYRLEASAGKTLTIDVEATDGLLLPGIALYDGQGQLVTAGQDMTGLGAPVHLSYQFEEAGTYYVSVGSAYPWPYPMNPFDSGSGIGVGTEGPYTMTLTVATADVDVFAVDLAPGDVLGATVRGSARKLSVFDPDGVLVQGSGLDVSALFPANSPLPGGGNATTDHVAAVGGRHYVAISDGAGGYDATVEVYRAGGERPETQTIFLDFDGARVNNNIFGAAAIVPGVRELSGLDAFLDNWGLTQADRPALVEAVTRTVRDNLSREVADGSTNPRVDVRITNSEDDRDTFGRPGVSRVIVGGTIEEAGIFPVIGIAQSVDPGNFSRTETALVLLDQMSAPTGNVLSLNTYLADGADRIAFLGEAIGNVVSHEAGHYLGNWHTSDMSGVTSLMDTGHVFDLYGLGPDLMGGTTDDVDNRFTSDRFEETQGFSGLENNLDRTGYALTRGRTLVPARH